MPGTALDNFNDFMTVTGPAYIRGPEDIINEAARNNYLLSRFLKGRDTAEIAKSGDRIKDVIMFDESNTYQTYKPNATFTWSNPQVLDEIEIPWRFSVDHMTWTDQEVDLNVGTGMTKNAIKTHYKTLKRSKEQRMWTSLLNGIEDALFADAANQQSEMEAAAGQTQYSIPAFITEDTTNYHPTGWTTVEGIDPANESKWRNQVVTYDESAPLDETNGIISAFDDMFFRVQYIPPATRQEFFEKTTLNRQMILASRDGVNQYKRALRASNDRLVTPQDAAYNSPAYSGVSVDYVAKLDTATIYDSATEDNDTPSGPRYWWINANYLKIIFHSMRYMKTHKPMRHPNQPFTTVQPVDCWWNLFCNSRQRNGIVAPSP